MKQLETVRILGIDYAIHYSDFIKTNGNSGCDGNLVTGQCVINIDTETTCEQFGKSILLHEIIEAITHRLSLEMPHEMLQQLHEGLFTVIRDNPKLLKYLAD